MNFRFQLPHAHCIFQQCSTAPKQPPSYPAPLRRQPLNLEDAAKQPAVQSQQAKTDKEPRLTSLGNVTPASSDIDVEAIQKERNTLTSCLCARWRAVTTAASPSHSRSDACSWPISRDSFAASACASCSLQVHRNGVGQMTDE